MEARFPYPSEVPTPPGAEGWEEMYPYYFIPNDEVDRECFYFRDPLHIPEPLPPFDAIWPESWLRYLAPYSARVFVLPATRGLKGFFFQGSLYWSPVEIVDPEEIKKRLEFFMKRAGYYYEHWEDIYKRWWEKVTTVIEELRAMEIKDLPDVEEESVVFEAKGIDKGLELLHAYRKMLNLNDLNWSYHFEMLNLGYAAYVIFVDFCRKAFPGILDKTITAMVGGVDFVMYRPIEELKRLAKEAVKLGITGVLKKPIKPEEIIEELKVINAGKKWLQEFEKSKEWFYMRAGKGVWPYHYSSAWLEDLTIPFEYIKDFIIRLESGISIEKPKEEIIKERDRITEEYFSLLTTDEDRKMFRELLEHVKNAYIYVEDHMWPTEHIFVTIFYQKMREIARILIKQGFIKEVDDVFYLNRYEVEEALWDLAYSWAMDRPSAGKVHWPKVTERRKKIIEALRKAPPPPDFLYKAPKKITEPLTIMLWGRTTDVIKEALAPRVVKPEEITEIRGIPASAGVIDGTCRVITRVEDLDQMQMDEILVAPVTNPAWAAAFGRLKGIVTDMGGMMSHASIVAREYGIPAVVNTGIATKVLKTGETLEVNGTDGVVRRLELSKK